MPKRFVWSHAGVRRSRRTTLAKHFHKDDKDEPECSICHLYLHVSGLECDCCPGRRVCLHHADNLCECDPSRWRLVYRYSLQDLDSILQQVSSHTPGEGRWAKLPYLHHADYLCECEPQHTEAATASLLAELRSLYVVDIRGALLALMCTLKLVAQYNGAVPEREVFLDVSSWIQSVSAEPCWSSSLVRTKSMLSQSHVKVNSCWSNCTARFTECALMQPGGKRPAKQASNFPPRLLFALSKQSKCG